MNLRPSLPTRAWAHVRRTFFTLLGIVSVAAPLRGAATASAAPNVAFDQNIGRQLPLDVLLRDEAGATTTFGQALGNKPAVLVFGYSRCPQLCSVVANATVETLRALQATAGRDFSVLYVSIDPTDTPRDLAAMKRRDVGRYGRTKTEAGWHYLGGSDAAVRRLTDAAGFRYTYDPDRKLYAHASGFVVVTPDGRVSRYFLGVDFDAKDAAAALSRAAEGKTGESVFNLILVCARGLGISGRYGPLIWGILQGAVALTLLVVFGGIGWMLWQERREMSHQ